MSTTTKNTETPERPDYAQYVVCVVLLAVGGFLIYDALSLPGGYAKVDPVGPRLFPIVIGVGLVLMTVVLAIAIARGSRVSPTAARTSTSTSPATGAPSACWSHCSSR